MGRNAALIYFCSPAQFFLLGERQKWLGAAPKPYNGRDNPNMYIMLSKVAYNTGKSTKQKKKTPSITVTPMLF